jgi:AcrR family transcriptional regulator
MRKPRTDGAETRQRLLGAGAELFAQKGFWEATTAAICRRAQANAAAVNYHFGDKETLYRESWRFAFARSVKKHPPDGGVRATASADVRLHGRILALLRRLLDPESHDFDIAHKEIANPTGLLSEIIPPCIEPIRRDLLAVVAELLGRDPADPAVRFCHMSIMGQCFGPLLRHRRRQQHPVRRIPGANCAESLPSTDPEVLAEHITRFSLAGIKAARQEAGKPIPGGKPPRKISSPREAS